MTNHDTDFDGCNRECRKAGKHTLRWGGCEHAAKPEPTVSMSKVYTDVDGYPSIGYDQYTVAQLADLIEPALRTVHARLGPNALAMLHRGETVSLSAGEYADLAREAAHAIVHRNDGPAPAAVSVPPPAPRADDQADLRDRIARALERKDALHWGYDHGFANRYGVDAETDAFVDAVLAVLPAPADRAAVLREAAEALGRMDYDTDSNDYGYDTYRDAWNGGVMDGADLLRRLADESAVVPPPALTEEGRLRAQVEVLQQDSERDQGLAKVGARCMRDGHQGLIEQGRLVLEGWRFALSTALDLDTGAPWEAIHERVKELCPAAAVSGPVAGEQQNETPEGAPESCAHCGKTILRITGTLAEWWVHAPGGNTICVPEQAASSPRATPKPTTGACPHNHTWPDRSVCLPPCGAMHDRCVDCETPVDDCPNDAGVRQDGAQQ